MVLCDCTGQTKTASWTGRNAFERNRTKKPGLLFPTFTCYFKWSPPPTPPPHPPLPSPSVPYSVYHSLPTFCMYKEGLLVVVGGNRRQGYFERSTGFVVQTVAPRDGGLPSGVPLKFWGNDSHAGCAGWVNSKWAQCRHLSEGWAEHAADVVVPSWKALTVLLRSVRVGWGKWMKYSTSK